MKSTTGRSGAAVVGLMFSILSAGTASAQWHSSAVGVLEYDTKQTWLTLAGVSASPGSKGIQPIIGLQGYALGYKSGSTQTHVFTSQPYVGLANNYNGGALAGTVGYAFTSNSVSAPVRSTVTGDQGKGVVTSGSWDQWGTGGPVGYQVLASYNWGGSKSLWTRGRVTTNLTPGGPSQRRVGVELAYLEGKGYSAYQPGGVLEFHDPRGNILGLGAGMKFFGNGAGNAVYFKVEGVVPLMR